MGLQPVEKERVSPSLSQEEVSCDFFSLLPQELIKEIMSYVADFPGNEIVHCRGLSSLYKRVCDENPFLIARRKIQQIKNQLIPNFRDVETCKLLVLISKTQLATKDYEGTEQTLHFAKRVVDGWKDEPEEEIFSEKNLFLSEIEDLLIRSDEAQVADNVKDRLEAVDSRLSQIFRPLPDPVPQLPNVGGFFSGDEYEKHMKNSVKNRMNELEDLDLGPLNQFLLEKAEAQVRAGNIEKVDKFLRQIYLPPETPYSSGGLDCDDYGFKDSVDQFLLEEAKAQVKVGNIEEAKEFLKWIKTHRTEDIFGLYETAIDDIDKLVELFAPKSKWLEYTLCTMEREDNEQGSQEIRIPQFFDDALET